MSASVLGIGFPVRIFLIKSGLKLIRVNNILVVNRQSTVEVLAATFNSALCLTACSSVLRSCTETAATGNRSTVARLGRVWNCLAWLLQRAGLKGRRRKIRCESLKLVGMFP